MSALSSSAVTIEDGEITIAAHLLAQKLGLSIDALKAEMRRGYVYSLGEQGSPRTRGARASPSATAPARGTWWSNRIARWSRPRPRAPRDRRPPGIERVCCIF